MEEKLIRTDWATKEFIRAFEIKSEVKTAIELLKERLGHPCKFTPIKDLSVKPGSEVDQLLSLYSEYLMAK